MQAYQFTARTVLQCDPKIQDRTKLLSLCSIVIQIPGICASYSRVVVYYRTTQWYYCSKLYSANVPISINTFKNLYKTHLYLHMYLCYCIYTMYQCICIMYSIYIVYTLYILYSIYIVQHTMYSVYHTHCAYACIIYAYIDPMKCISDTLWHVPICIQICIQQKHQAHAVYKLYMYIMSIGHILVQVHDRH